jgi:hypothetical protein
VSKAVADPIVTAQSLCAHMHRRWTLVGMLMASMGVSTRPWFGCLLHFAIMQVDFSTKVEPLHDATPAEPVRVHLHMPVDVRSVSLALLALLVSVYMLHWASAVFIPLLLGIMCSYTLSPAVDRLQRWHVPRSIGTAAQDLQHRDQCRMRLVRRAQRATQADAVWQVVAQELVDATFVEHACRQVAHRHPVREVRHAVQAARTSVSGVAAALQSGDVRRDLGEQRAFEEPGPQHGVQFRDLGHDGLPWWSRQCCA